LKDLADSGTPIGMSIKGSECPDQLIAELFVLEDRLVVVLPGWIESVGSHPIHILAEGEKELNPEARPEPSEQAPGNWTVDPYVFRNIDHGDDLVLGSNIWLRYRQGSLGQMASRGAAWVAVLQCNFAGPGYEAERKKVYKQLAADIPPHRMKGLSY